MTGRKTAQDYARDNCECLTLESRETCERPCGNSRKPRISEPTTALHVATLETRSFSFEAYGDDHDSAWGALVQGLSRHGQSRGLPGNWFADCLGDIHVRPVTLGAVYRDREPI